MKYSNSLKVTNYPNSPRIDNLNRTLSVEEMELNGKKPKQPPKKPTKIKQKLCKKENSSLRCFCRQRRKSSSQN